MAARGDSKMTTTTTSITTASSSPLKRPPSDDLDLEQPLTKRFNLLGINVQSLYHHQAPPSNPPSSSPAPLPASLSSPSSPSRARSNAFSTVMQLDDTRDRIYIGSLDDEISEVELAAQERQLVFLPDVERQITAIPASILTGRMAKTADDAEEKLVGRGFTMGGGSMTKSGGGGEMVLYGVPESISIPQTQDHVRKAILEARERARRQVGEDTASRPSGDANMGIEGQWNHGKYESQLMAVDGDEDAMEIE